MTKKKLEDLRTGLLSFAVAEFENGHLSDNEYMEMYEYTDVVEMKVNRLLGKEILSKIPKENHEDFVESYYRFYI